MPDYTVSPEDLARRARRAAEIATKARVVERCGPAGPTKCERCNGIGSFRWPSEDGGSPWLECPDCRGKGHIPCSPSPASLTWTTFGMDVGGMQTAGDGRYLVASEPRGYVAKVYEDSKEVLLSDIYASRREACAWCQGIEDWRAMCAKEMERTAEHEPLKVEVVEDVA